jgi:hypothetical protein
LAGWLRVAKTIHHSAMPRFCCSKYFPCGPPGGCRASQMPVMAPCSTVFGPVYPFKLVFVYPGLKQFTYTFSVSGPTSRATTLVYPLRATFVLEYVTYASCHPPDSHVPFFTSPRYCSMNCSIRSSVIWSRSLNSSRYLLESL